MPTPLSSGSLRAPGATASAPRVRRGLVALLAVTLVLAQLSLAGGTSAQAQEEGAPSARDIDQACAFLGDFDPGFDDIGGLADDTQAAISCLAYYELTQGTGPTTYSPHAEVSRVDMAVFLKRLLDYAADSSDLTIPDPEPQDFTDVAGLSQERVDAVDLLGTLEITLGYQDGTFRPFQSVSRIEMASFLVRVQNLLEPGSYDTDEEFFSDVPDSLDRSAEVNALAAQGIVQGRPDGTYDPFAPVLRSQMALFLMRHVDENVDAGRLDPAPPEVVITDPTSDDPVEVEPGGDATVAFALRRSASYAVAVDPGTDAASGFEVLATGDGQAGSNDVEVTVPDDALVQEHDLRVQVSTTNAFGQAITAEDIQVGAIEVAEVSAPPPPPPPPDPEPGSISGQVTEAGSDDAIVGAVVADDDAQLQATTGDDGSYLLEDVDPGEYELTATAEGYEASDPVSVPVGDGEDVTGVDFALSSTAEPDVTITSVGEVSDGELKVDFDTDIAGDYAVEFRRSERDGYYRFDQDVTQRIETPSDASPEFPSAYRWEALVSFADGSPIGTLAQHGGDDAVGWNSRLSSNEGGAVTHRSWNAAVGDWTEAATLGPIGHDGEERIWVAVEARINDYDPEWDDGAGGDPGGGPGYTYVAQTSQDGTTWSAFDEVADTVEDPRGVEFIQRGALRLGARRASGDNYHNAFHGRYYAFRFAAAEGEGDLDLIADLDFRTTGQQDSDSQWTDALGNEWTVHGDPDYVPPVSDDWIAFDDHTGQADAGSNIATVTVPDGVAEGEYDVRVSVTSAAGVTGSDVATEALVLSVR